MNKEIRKEIDNFDEFQKLTVYMDYYVTQLGLKHNFMATDVVVTKSTSYLKEGQKYPGLGEPDKQVHNLGFWYLWKDIRIMTFEEFVNGRKGYFNNHQDWEHPSGIYEWYPKFKDRICLPQQ